MEGGKSGFVVTFLLWLFSGLAGILVDLPSLLTYEWSNGIPNYQALLESPHRFLHDPIFCFLLCCPLHLCLITLIRGYRKHSENVQPPNSPLNSMQPTNTNHISPDSK